ncbi:hypothetical protein ABT095_01645 [Kitasatospora sp. NPDC002227]|uniref:hypothetical protein n=1 Tax=Kitasatospora sp. NPDC002227 TaxID=3154773 RepID=UPI0033172577
MHTLPNGRSTRRAAGALLAAVLLTSGAAACSSGSSSSKSSPSSSASAGSSSGPSASPTTASPSATAPADPAAAKALVKADWEKFFDPATPLTGKAALLQNGDQLLPLLQGFSQDPRVGQVKAQVSDVTFTSPTSATVTYSLSLQGNVVQPNASGTAVLDNGTWKVSRSSLCGLVTLSGATALPGCS